VLNLKSLLRITFLIMGLMIVWTVPAWAANQLATNIPLDSYIYTYLDKLDGLGYLPVVQTGTKPYTRMQAAGWVREMQQQAVAEPLPEYAQKMLDELITDLGPELAALDGAAGNNRLHLRELAWENTYYDGPTLKQNNKTKSTYKPLNINNNGYRLADDLNSILNLQIEGAWNDRLVFSATPRLSYDRTEDVSANLEAGYLKTRLSNLQIQLGKDPIWWGQGERGSLALSNNMEPLTALKLSNLEPLSLPGWFKYLGPANATFFYSKLSDDRTDVKQPAFVGLRTDFTPGSNFTFAAGLTSFLGGEGHEFGWDDLWDFLTQKNADNSADEKWNTIAGFDFRWRLPQLNGLQIYGEFYGEDQAGSFPPLPSRNAGLFGVYLPRLTADGAWDLQLEAARTTRYWYSHWLYKEGYTHEGDIIGDAMGHNAKRYYAQLSHYLAGGTRLGLHGEYVSLDQAATYPQEVSSLWLSYTTKLRDAWTLNATAGLADIDHLDYTAGKTERNYLFSVELRKPL